MRAFVYRGIRALAIPFAIVVPAAAQQVREGPSDIGYPTVAAALDSLRAKSDVTQSVQSGWTIFEDRAALTIWSFAPSDDPAYPSAVRRTIVTKDGSTLMNMRVLCAGSKSSLRQTC